MSTSKSNFELQSDLLFAPTSFTPTIGTLTTLTIGATSGSETVIGSTKFTQANVAFTSTASVEALGHFTYTFPTTTPFTSAPSISLTIKTTTGTTIGWTSFASTISATAATIYLRQDGTAATPSGTLSILLVGEV